MYYGELEYSQLNIWGGVALTVVVWLLMTPAYYQWFNNNNNNNNNNLHFYRVNLYMNVFGCALQYCYIKFMLKVTKA